MFDTAPVAALTPPGPVTADVASLLKDVPLFGDIPAEDLDEFASAFVRVELAAGELLWRQGTEVEGLHVLLSGRVQVCRCLPGERELELARLGAGAVMGEIPLLGGGTHSAMVRAVSPCSLLFLDRAQFHARMVSRRPSALELRRRIVAIACDRVRVVHAALRGFEQPTPASPSRGWSVPSGEPAAPPTRTYLARLPFFRGLAEDVVTALLDAGETLHMAPRSTIVPEGTRSSCCFVVLNGAIEDVVPRDGGTIRVGFAGPGHATGYLGLLDGRPASATSVARERSTLLAISARDFDALMQRGDERSQAFVAAIERDLMGSLRTAERAKSHLAAVAAP
ncbi:MAG: family transcriptional regulator, cyclic receptor protein [Solirubrobacteraceae bacterium]|jgi:CRP-like cAMP-binding protein|nr:family transcriptional regulator, cyclic receptor protein [Solirubrobacteraceae bacterium]